jgi:hypothetical protein
MSVVELSSAVAMQGSSHAVAGQSSQKFGQLSQNVGQLSEACADRVVTFLRSRYPSKTAESVAAETGLGVDRIRKWLERGSKPSCAACFVMIAVYGPEFLSAVMHRPPAWIATAARAARREQLRAEISDLEARLEADERLAA